MQILDSFSLPELAEPETLKKSRKKYFEHFLERGLPQRKSNGYDYEDYTALFAKRFTPAAQARIACPIRNNPFVVLVNGVYNKELSNTTGFDILPLSQAYRTYGTLLANSGVKETVNPFALLNGALHADGIFVYIPPKSVPKVPLEIISIAACDSHSYVMPRIVLFLGNSSELTVIHTKVIEKGCFYNASFDISIEDNAKLTFEQQDLKSSGWIFEHFDFSLKRASTLKATFVGTAVHTRRDLIVKLTGEGADAELSGLWQLDGKMEMHTNVHIEHEAPHCRSLQLFKGVLDDEAVSSFQGKIKVQKKAQKTEAYQINNNLILSDKAHANSKPNLEIFADDVKASHGATVGALDFESLFYLRSRGIYESEAKKLLIQGFCEEVHAKLHKR